MNKLIVGLFSLFLSVGVLNAMNCSAGKCGGGGSKCANSSKGMGNPHGKKMNKNYRAVHPSKATLLQEGKNKMYCPICGMTLPKFYKTNHASDDESGKTHQYCSIVCKIEDEVINGKKMSNHRVVDNTTLKFIDANKAYFVVGSKKPATMSAISKYAFGTKKAAKKFAMVNGGEIMNLDDLYKLVEKQLKKDLQATKKRQAKAARMGEKIYNKMCKKTELRFSKVAEAKSYLKTSGICGNIKGKKHQQVALFLSGKK